MPDIIKPYYQVNHNINYNIIVAVFGDQYAFDCLERATDFIQQILMYSVERPTITLFLSICEVEK